MTGPLYMAEVAPKRFRGGLLTFYQLSICLGIVIAFWVNVGLQKVQFGWRICVWVQLGPCLLLTFGMLCMPPSPRWLLQRNRASEARRVFFKLRGIPLAGTGGHNHIDNDAHTTTTTTTTATATTTTSRSNRQRKRKKGDGLKAPQQSEANAADDDAFSARLEFEQLLASQPSRTKRTEEQPWQRELRNQGKCCSAFNLKMLAIGCSFQLLQQFCGVNAFMYYGPQIFDDIGLGPFVFTAGVGMVNFVLTLPTLFLMVRCGRIALLQTSFLGMAVCCFTLATVGIVAFDDVDSLPNSNSSLVVTDSILTNTNTSTATIGAQVVSVLSTFGFIAFFASGAGPVVWAYCAEIFPASSRARNVGFTSFTNWIGNLLVAQLTPMMLASFGFGTFIVYGFFCLGGFALALYAPETRGVLLEDIPRLFASRFRHGGCNGCCGSRSVTNLAGMRRQRNGGKGVVAFCCSGVRCCCCAWRFVLSYQ